jgi:hypothetical protein
MLELPDSTATPLISSRASDPPAGALRDPVAGEPPRPETAEEALIREAIKLMDDLAGVRAAMAMLAEEGQIPGVDAPRSPRDSAPSQEDPAPGTSSQPAPLMGGAPSGGAAGAGGGGGGSAALYALMIALAAAAGGLCGRVQIVPVRWRSVTIVALNERPG